jgi:hypothetical protein
MIRFYWPTIISICAQDENTKKFAEELHALRTPASPKPLPRWLQQACRLTAETIATTMLIAEEVTEPPPGEVNLTAARMQQYNEPDLGEYWGM